LRNRPAPVRTTRPPPHSSPLKAYHDCNLDSPHSRTNASETRERADADALACARASVGPLRLSTATCGPPLTLDRTPLPPPPPRPLPPRTTPSSLVVLADHHHCTATIPSQIVDYVSCGRTSQIASQNDAVINGKWHSVALVVMLFMLCLVPPCFNAPGVGNSVAGKGRTRIIKSQREGPRQCHGAIV
jgi:hypothetical protein